MISKKRIVLAAIVVLILLVGFSNISRLIPESKNYTAYKQALEEYNNDDFMQAYNTFDTISRFSKLKPAAEYRQALCADKVGDTKTEIKKFKDVIRNYPNSAISIRAKYLKAQQIYISGNYRKAKKEFKSIINKYPDTDYAVASEYYLGSIETVKISDIKDPQRKLKAQNKAIKHFKAYLVKAPTGRFALNCVKKWLAFGIKLNNEDNLLVAKIYQDNADYSDSLKYLKLTNISLSWPYFVKDYYALKDYPKVKYYTELGLKGKFSDDVLINEVIDNKTQNENSYKAIDTYLKLSDSPKLSISYLLSISEESPAYEYLFYKKCNNLPEDAQTACYNSLYYKYPDGQFAAEALSNIFYAKIKSQDFITARKLGQSHLSKFPKVNSTPKVMFWLGKIAERNRNFEEARGYFRSVINQFPDDYYAYNSYLNLNKFRHFRVRELKKRNVEFPYRNSGSNLITALANVQDYGLINQLYPDNDFIQSWIAYLEGDFSRSSTLARDAMEKLPTKPDSLDPKWNLVYPVHYYDIIRQNAKIWNNDPILILSIIREESYFNPNAKSGAGAYGLMQLMPYTAMESANKIGLSVPNYRLLFDPETNIKLGNIYYSKLKKSLYYKDMLAVVAYNGGLASVARWIQNLNCVDVDDFVEQIPYPETQNYLKKVYRSYWNYLRIYTHINF